MTSAIERLAATVADGVRRDGFHRIDRAVDEREFLALAEGLGDVWGDVSVRLVPGRRTYLASPDAIPIHTDHPGAAWIAWRCEAQDPVDGSSWLVDGHAVARAFDPRMREVLARTELPAMVRLGDPATRTRIVDESTGAMRLFFAPWLSPIDPTPDVVRVVDAWTTALEAAPVCEVRLLPGQVLVVDNRRMLHGRARLSPGSPRRLRRLWIADRQIER